MDRKQIRKLATRLCFELLVRAYFCGGVMLLSPIICFSSFADDSIFWQVVGIGAACAVPALWFCCFDFVRLAKKRGYEPFCSVWMKVLPEDATATELFLILLKTGLPSFIIGGFIAVKYLDGLGIAPLLATPVWFLLARYTMAKLLADKLANRDEISGGSAPAIVVKEDPRTRGQKTWHGFKDFIFWSWIAAPLWMAFWFTIPGAVFVPRNDAATAFFEAPEEPLRDDGFYALAGLYAPLGTKDFVAFGKQEAARIEGGGRIAAVGTNDVLQDMPGHFNICTGPKPPPVEKTAPQRPPIPGEKIAEPAPPKRSLFTMQCLYLEEWGPIIKANAEMLERYRKLYEYRDFRTPLRFTALGIYKAQFVIELSRLQSIAHALRAYSGDPEGAMDDLIAHARFAARLSDTPASALGYAVSMMVYYYPTNQLGYVLSKKPELAAKYLKPLEETLLFLDYNDFDYMKIWETEMRSIPYLLKSTLMTEAPPSGSRYWFEYIITNYFVSERILLNKFYEMTEDVRSALAHKDIPSRTKALEAIPAKYKVKPGEIRFTHLSEMFYMAQSLATQITAMGHAKDIVVFLPDGRSTNRDRQRLVFVAAMAEGAFPGHMPAFLKEAAARDPRFSDVRDGKPFEWDEKEQGVCFEMRDDVFGREPLCFSIPKYVEREDQLQ